MGRAPCCEKMGLKKGPWTPDEDQILINYIRHHGHNNWRALPKQAGLLRCGKSCRLRWTNYLRPDIKRGNFTPDEEETIIKLHEMLGNRWSAIAAKLPGRTDNEIKNVWHTHLKKRLPKPDPDSNSNSNSVNVDDVDAGAAVEPAVEPPRKRARKSKGATKRGTILEKSRLDSVKRMDSGDINNNDIEDVRNNNNNNNNNNNEDSDGGVGPTSPIIRGPASPQPCTSGMSTITASSTSCTSASENDKRGKENVGDIKEDYFDDFGEINDDFWREVLSVEDTAMSTTEDMTSITQYDQNTSRDPLVTEPLFESSFKVHSDDMDFFWYNLLTRSTELPELSEML